MNVVHGEFILDAPVAVKVRIRGPAALSGIDRGTVAVDALVGR